ncbi:MAG: alpha-2,8-polysialyltransferase family protein [Bacteroidales bacterium]|nr:alpha-2,8-polysialyltransferase family protein [Bacteroidales bacterium]
MKHVFYVTSHLTFNIANKIVELDAISPDDCILLLAREYQIPEKFNACYPHQIHTSYNISVSQGRVFAGANIFKTRKNIQHFDSLVDEELLGEDFLWYASVCSNDVCSLMVTKKNCKGFFIIEDGLASYRGFNPQTFTGIRYIVYKLVLKPFFRRIFEVKNHFISNDSPKFKGCIATNERCFPLHQDCLRIIGLPFEDIDLGFQPDAVLSVDPMFLFINEGQTKEVYGKLAAFIHDKGYKSLAYKLHPRFNAKSNAHLKATYLDMLNHSFSIPLIELAPDVVLESVLKSYRCDFYTSNSSVAIYGSAAGAQCFTYIPLLQSYTSAFDNDKLILEICKPVEKY